MNIQSLNGAFAFLAAAKNSRWFLGFETLDASPCMCTRLFLLDAARELARKAHVLIGRGSDTNAGRAAERVIIVSFICDSLTPTRDFRRIDYPGRSRDTYIPSIGALNLGTAIPITPHYPIHTGRRRCRIGRAACIREYYICKTHKSRREVTTAMQLACSIRACVRASSRLRRGNSARVFQRWAVVYTARGAVGQISSRYSILMARASKRCRYLAG